MMAYPANIPMAVTHLAELVDDILYYAGDKSPDVRVLALFVHAYMYAHTNDQFEWYTKRAGLAAVYTSTELFMTQDYSTDYAETFRFLERRLEQAKRLQDGKREVTLHTAQVAKQI